MPQSNDGIKGYVAAAALTRGQRVKLSSGQAAVAGAGEEGIGTARQSCDSGSHASILLDHPTREMIAAGAISAGANVYAAATGRVSATISGRRQGIALEAATTAGDYLEVMVAGVNS